MQKPGNDKEEVTMTYSAILRDARGQKIVRVRFERGKGKARSFAEGILPGGEMEKSTGFSKEELANLTKYLKEHESEIMDRAKGISNPMSWL